MLSTILKFVSSLCFLNGDYQGVDLVVSVGGDGTALSASHYLSGTIPLLGVNSDPGDEVDNSASEHILSSYWPGCLVCVFVYSPIVVYIQYNNICRNCDFFSIILSG